MSVTQLNGVCPAILVGFNELAAPENLANLKTPIGGVEALLDPANTQGVTMKQLNNSEGHEKTVRVSWKQRQTVSDVAESKSCDEGSEKPYFEDTFNVTQEAELKFKIKESTIRTLCKAHSDYLATGSAPAIQVMRELAEEINTDLDAIRQKINQSFHEAYALNIGKFVGGSTYKEYKVLKSATDHAIVTAGFNKMKQDLREIGFSGTPYVVGKDEISYAMDSLGVGCCNDGGINIAGVSSKQNMKFFYDSIDFNTYYGPDVNGSSPFIMFYPKMAQLVTYNKYVGDFAKPLGTMQRGTLPDPLMPGLSYDIRLLPSECDEEYDLFINASYDFWFAPLTLFKSGDRLNGVNGLLKGFAGYAS